MYYGYLATTPEAELRTPYTLYPDDAVIIWCEVLALAVLDLEKPEFQQKAVEWFISNKFEVGSFLWVCHVLNIESKAVRKKLSQKIYIWFH